MGCIILSGTRVENLRHVLLAVSLWICVYVCVCVRYIYIYLLLLLLLLLIFLIPQTLHMSVLHFMNTVSDDGLDSGCPD